METLGKIAVIVYSGYLMWTYATGRKMWAPYYTPENTPEERPWRILNAGVSVLVFIVAVYWLVVDFVE